ncbi:MAG: rRNA pseudouridine synthase [Puniceicoccales bacterium]|jgi:23S rRNA pseudouridine2605 synthase|nr:rRNA pseudouridine synthase [Puniceicoccales bacterium]
MTNGQFMRLQRYLSLCGICSRRRAEDAISRGEVLVNGQRAQLGMLIRAGESTITFHGEEIRLPKRKSPTVIALHKPRGYLCTHSDPHHGDGKTIYALLPLHRQRKLICCGRLDKNSEGLVLLTDDGSLAAALLHPSRGIEKFYHVTIDKPLEENHQRVLRAGVEEGGERLTLHSLRVLAKCQRQITIVLHAGRKRHIRRMLGALGYEVRQLIRYRIGSFGLGTLPPGRHRRLTEAQVAALLQNPDRLTDSFRTP